MKLTDPANRKGLVFTSLSVFFLALGLGIGAFAFFQGPSGSWAKTSQEPAASELLRTAHEANPKDMGSLSDLPLWRQGNSWIYRVKRRSTARGTDEAARLDYRVKRTIVQTTQTQDGIRVQFREQGGHLPGRKADWHITSDCIRRESNGEKLFCRSASHTQDVFRDEKYPALKWNSDQRSSIFSPVLGLTKFERVNDEGRRHAYSLAGLRIDEDRIGVEPDVLTKCDWTEEVTEPMTQRQLSVGDRRRYAGLLGNAATVDELQVQQIPLSGRHGSDRVTLAYTGTASLLAFENNGELVATRRFPTKGYVAKVFHGGPQHGDFLHVVLAEGADVQLLLVQIHEGRARGIAWRFDRNIHERDYFGGFILAHLGNCFFQFRNLRPDDSRVVANFGVTQGGFKNTGGSLKSEDSERFSLEFGN